MRNSPKYGLKTSLHPCSSLSRYDYIVKEGFGFITLISNKVFK